MHFEQITEDTVFDAVIVSNGDFPTAQIPCAILSHARYLCCCDRAGMTAISHGLMPQAIVGDGDSMPQAFLPTIKDIFHQVDEQDDNDLTKATRFVRKQGMKHIAYVGATGKREDHTLANISLMVTYYRDFGLQPVMVTDYGWFVVAEGNASFDTFPGQQVSIFNISCHLLQSEGLKWNLYPFKELWQGTLNEATAQHINIKADGIVIAYFTFEAKSDKI